MAYRLIVMEAEAEKGVRDEDQLKTRRGSPVDRRPSTTEAPQRGEIHPFSKMTVTFEPLNGF